ncbi:hypothetical protein ACFKHW_12985 [Bradyrhizobium lupini]|uniref:hypothetical protein n=1 Tax=Rhizobium lupini TaxID=136996 RepID=UPI00367279DD
MGAKLYRITDQTAARMMDGLRIGQTPRMFAIRPARLTAYFETNPEFAAKARPLIEANAKAAELRKSAGKRDKTHCSRGHAFTPANTRFRKNSNDPRSECKTCERERAVHGNAMPPGSADRVRELLKKNARIASFTSAGRTGYVMSHRTFSRLRREDSEIDMLAVKIVEGARSGALHTRWGRIRNQAAREQQNDYYTIRAMLPENFPDKDDVVSAIFEDLLTGVLRREDVKALVKSYVSAQNKMFPTKYAKFGDSLLVSLDEALFDNGGGTRGDNVSRGLWD